MSADPYVYVPDGLSVLLWWPIRDVLSEYDSRIGETFSHSESFAFPDRSVELTNADDIRRFWVLMSGYGQSGLEVRQNTMWRSLACFPRQTFQLWSTWHYFDRIGGEQDFLVAPVWACDSITPNEYERPAIRVDVQFWRSPTRETKDAFRNEIQRWSDTNARTSAFDGESASVSPESIRFVGKQCKFQIDVSNGSQRLVNWLVLSVLNFGANVWPVSEVRFCGHP